MDATRPSPHSHVRQTQQVSWSSEEEAEAEKWSWGAQRHPASEDWPRPLGFSPLVQTVSATPHASENAFVVHCITKRVMTTRLPGCWKSSWLFVSNSSIPSSSPHCHLYFSRLGTRRSPSPPGPKQQNPGMPLLPRFPLSPPFCTPLPTSPI